MLIFVTGFYLFSPARTSGIWPNKGAAEQDGGGDLLEDIGTFSSITSSLLHLTSPYYSHILIIVAVGVNIVNI